MYADVTIRWRMSLTPFMGRLRLVISALLTSSTLAFGVGSSALVAESADLPIERQDGCELEVSGTVRYSESAYPTWVEYHFETDAMGEAAGPWLSSEVGSTRVETNSDGSYSLCATSPYDGESLSRLQIFAYPDLSEWNGSDPPDVGYTASSIVAVQDCAGSCDLDVEMQPPTIWSDAPADFYFVYSDDGFVTSLPAYGYDSSDRSSAGKMAAAYPFDAAQGIEVQAHVATSGDPATEPYPWETIFAVNLEADDDGVVGAFAAPNLFVKFEFPSAFPEPERDDDGRWPEGSYAQVYMFRIDGEDGPCTQEMFLGLPECQQSFNHLSPLEISSTLTSGSVYLVAATAGILPITYRVMRIEDDGSLSEWADLDSYIGGDEPTSIPGPFTTDAPYLLEMSPPDLVVGPHDEGQAVTEGVSVRAQQWKASECGGSGCFMWMAGEQPSNGGGGLFGWSPSDGIWMIEFTATDDFSYSSEGPNWARTAHVVEVGADGAFTSCTYSSGESPDCSGDDPFTPDEDGVYRFQVDHANVIVSVIGLDGEPVPSQTVEIGPADRDWAEFGTSTTREGKAGFNLALGNWKVLARAPDGDLDQADGEELFEITAGDTADDPLLLTVTLSEPNITGQVLQPDDTPSRWSGLGVQSYDLETRNVRNVRWTQTDIEGHFAINLGEGMYRLTLDPPASNRSLPRTSVYLMVDSNGDPCVVGGFDDTECDEPSPAEGFLFRFATPNFSGRLILESGVGVAGWAQAAKWNGSYYDWSDNGAQIDASGRFSLVLEPDNYYKIEVDPRQSSGASRTAVHIRMGDDGFWCLTSADPVTQAPELCDPTSTGVVTIETRGANFSGMATDLSGDAVGNSWVDASVETEYGWRFFTGAQIRQNGSFSMRLERPGSTWELVKVTAYPTWGSSSLVKESRLYWVKDSEICADETKPTAGCSEEVTSSDLQEFVLTAGNVMGIVTMPDDYRTPASFVHIDVERQNDEGWWEWADTWAQTDEDGHYSLGLDDGFYRITARPFNREGVAATSIELTVDSDCMGCDAADIALSPPNVSGVVYESDGTTPVKFAWVGLEKWNGEYWEWIGVGDEADDDGFAAMSVAVTDSSETYRLTVNGPWTDPTPRPRLTSDEFTLVSDGTTEFAFALSFPEPNIKIVLLDESSDEPSTVANSWVGLEWWNGSYWEWQEMGSHSGRSGGASLYLACLEEDESCNTSEYRLVVDPPWSGSANLTRFTTPLDAVLGLPDNDDGQKELSFPSTNVNGRVLIDADHPNRNGWIEIFEWSDDTGAGSWITGNPVNRQGLFSLALADGSYLLRLRPNGTLATSPIEVLVEVVDGFFTSCSFRIGDESCHSDDFNIDVSFADRPSNLSIEVQLDGESLSVPAFVTLTSDIAGVSIKLVTDATGRLVAFLPPSDDYEIDVVVTTDDLSVATSNRTDFEIGENTGEADSDSPRTSVLISVSSGD